MIQAMRSITERTMLPLSLIISLGGGIAWFTSLYSLSESNSERIAELTKKQEYYLQFIQTIDRRLSRIEGKLGVKER